ncbi:MAG: hypothetical protein SGJ27_10605 [Candidatus Melainabacteria bacterium]|nr:hypothetical protein [Candidatus Melainabacteria bacterium]
MVKRYRKEDYPQRELEACHRILMEMVNLLHEFSDHIALVGGWVPFFIAKSEVDPHVGSLDVDVAFDFKNISTETYETVLAILKDNGYYQSNPIHKPFQWWKDVKIDDGASVPVEVDLLAPEYGGRGQRHENQFVQDTRARKARGCDLVFSRLEEVILEGALPNGSRDTVRCKVAGVVPFLVMKGMALGRGKPKDAYDIEYVIRNYPGGIAVIIELFQRDLDNKLVQEGLGRIRAKFESIDHTGPQDIVNFLGISEENKLVRRRDAFDIVSELLDALEVARFV